MQSTDMFQYMSITESQNATIFLLEIGKEKSLWGISTTDTY